MLVTTGGTMNIRVQPTRDYTEVLVIKRTGGAYESATIATALPARMKLMAGRIAQQYKQVSPKNSPAEEFRRAAPLNKKSRRYSRRPRLSDFLTRRLLDSSRLFQTLLYSPSPFIISIMC
jgi:hypothetical protein